MTIGETPPLFHKLVACAFWKYLRMDVAARGGTTAARLRANNDKGDV